MQMQTMNVSGVNINDEVHKYIIIDSIPQSGGLWTLYIIKNNINHITVLTT